MIGINRILTSDELLSAVSRMVADELDSGNKLRHIDTTKEARDGSRKITMIFK